MVLKANNQYTNFVFSVSLISLQLLNNSELFEIIFFKIIPTFSTLYLKNLKKASAGAPSANSMENRGGVVKGNKCKRAEEQKSRRTKVQKSKRNWIPVFTGMT